MGLIIAVAVFVVRRRRSANAAKKADDVALKPAPVEPERALPSNYGALPSRTETEAPTTSENYDDPGILVDNFDSARQDPESTTNYADPGILLNSDTTKVPSRTEYASGSILSD